MNKKKEATTLVKKCIVDALLLLMNEKDFDDITITEICTKADVSRMAYYRNYYTKKDIIIEYLKDIAEDFKKESHSWQEKKEYTNKNVIHFLFTYFKKCAYVF
jgi:AcrR family transcriptional regulator